MKKGRHRRFEEARALKRSQDVDLEDLFEDISGGSDDSEGVHKPEHDAWADLAAEWDSKNSDPVEVDADSQPTEANSDTATESE